MDYTVVFGDDLMVIMFMRGIKLTELQSQYHSFIHSYRLFL